MGQRWAEVGHTRIMVMDMWSDLGAKLIALDDRLKGMAGLMKLQFWEGYRKEGESAEEARERFKKETGFTEYEDSRAIGRGLHQSENLHYTEKGYGYKKLVQLEREKSIIKSERKEDA
jgi:hypothetical protein